MSVTTTTKMKTSSAAGRCAGMALAGALLFAPFTTPALAHAQHGKEPTQRLIEGSVEDKGSQPLPGAVVYLKDTKTLTVKSYLTDEHGKYRFGQLSLSTDYDLWATMDGKHSKTRHISAFNSRPTLDYTLKLDAEPDAESAQAPPAAAPPTTPQKAAEGTAAPLKSK